MDTKQILLTAGVGLVASLVTALVTNVFARRQERQRNVFTEQQERRRSEREVAEKLVELMNSTDKEVGQYFATQFARGCLIVERGSDAERERVFIPMGSRLLFGRSRDNDIAVDDPVLSRQHATFLARGEDVYLEPLGPTNGIAVNDARVFEPTKLANGDVVSVEGGSFKITFVTMRS